MKDTKREVMDVLALSNRFRDNNIWLGTRTVSWTIIQSVLVTGLLGFDSVVQAGAFIGAGEDTGVDLITHPSGYNFSGTENQLEINVCIVPGSPNAATMEQSVRNIIAVYNQLLPTTGNLRPGHLAGNQVDFESVALHEAGHCLGKAHVNLASESGLTEPDRNYTKSTDGDTPNEFDVALGVDGVRGSQDDIRGDDVNLHWYRATNNNPFTLDYSVVDSTTYSRDTGDLPTGHLFATNGDRTVATSLLNTPNTEAVMQQLTFGGEIQRTLTHDGVATLQYAMSGLDDTADTGDDYTFHLNFATSSCDINLSFNNSETGFAVCRVRYSYITNQSAIISSADIYFNTGFNWVFNSVAPCSEGFSVTQNQWAMFTPGCSLGISTSAVVTDVLGDDFTGSYYSTWVVYEWNAAGDVYRKLESTDELVTGRGYWIYSTEADHTVDIEGQYNGAPDILLSGSPAGTQNLIGHPFDFSVKWEDVQIINDDDDGAGSEVETILSLADAVTAGLIDVEFHKRECGGYEPYDIDGSGTVGYLNPSDGIWVKAYDDGIRLRVPSIEASAPVPDPCPAAEQVAEAVFEGSVESLGSEKVAATKTAHPESEYVIQDDGSWYARIIVESGKYRDKGNVFGQRVDAEDGQESRDLEELAPFGETYLTAVFPHDDWDPEPWAYTTDFRSTTKHPQGEWTFAVMSSIDIEEISVRVEGPDSILRKGRLRDLETGKLVKIRDGAYTFEANPGVRYFSFSVDGNTKNKGT